MTDVGDARRVRRLLGAEQVDRLYGTDGATETSVAMLATTPQDPHDIEDGRSLIAHIQARWPDGTPDEARRRRLRRLGITVLWAALGMLGLVLAIGLVESIASGEGMDARVGPVGRVAIIVMALVLAIGGLVFLAAAVSARRDELLRGREAIRWAADRPGQIARGIPTVAPFAGWVSLGILFSIIAWVVTLVVSFGAWSLRDPYTDSGTEVVLTWVAILLPPVLSVWITASTTSWSRAQRLAGRHLFLFTDDAVPGGADAATAWSERFLMLRTADLPGGMVVLRYDERAVFPLSVDLSDDERVRRHEAMRSGRRELTAVGDPAQAPIVTSMVPEPGEDNSGARSQIESRYRGGWYIATGLRGDEAVHVLLEADADPGTWADDVLPLFGERSGLDPGSLAPIPPQRVPADIREFHHWSRALHV